MIRLETTQKLQAVLGGAVSSTEADIVTSYRDEVATIQPHVTPGGASQLSTSSGATPVDIVDAPVQEKSGRVVEFISVRNNDTAAISLTLRYNDNGTTYKIITISLTSGDTLFYTPGTGFYVTDSNGAIRETQDETTGTWTPVLTFATPGNLAVVYSTQAGVWSKRGGEVRLTFNIITSTFTHTTASGTLQITGSPFTSANNGVVNMGTVDWQGITKANYTDINLRHAANTSTMFLQAMGSGQATATIAASDMPTGGNVRILGTILLPVA